MEYDLFISYKSEDEVLVDFIYQKFKSNGIVCFYDKVIIDKKLDEEIIKGIDKSKNYFVFFSKNVTNDSYFSWEFDKIREIANKQNKQIYFILFKVTKQEIGKIFLLPNYHIDEIKTRNELKDIITKISKKILINNLIEKMINDKNEKLENIIKDMVNSSPELSNIYSKSKKESSELIISNFFTHYEEITLEYLFNYFIEKQKCYFPFYKLLQVCGKNEYGIYIDICSNENDLEKIKIDIEVKEKLTNNKEKKKDKKSIYETLFSDKNICLKAKNVYFKYKKNEIIRNFNITVKYGEVIAIVGQNGIGKTTLLKILAYLISPSKGEIVYNFSKKLTIKQYIQYFFDLPKINGSVNQYLKYLLISNGRNCNETEDILNKLYKRFELEKYKDYKWKELSLGYQIRFLLVQTIILEPKLIILDEPLANIDKKMVKIFLEDLYELAKVYQFSIIFSSHYIEEITSKNVDKVIIFNKNSQIKSINLKKLESNYNTVLSIEVYNENEINNIMNYLKKNLAIKKIKIINENRIYLHINKEYENQIMNQLTNKFKINKLEDITTSSLRFYNEIF